MPEISVVVSTYGDIEHWGHLAHTRALPSVYAQTQAPEGVYYNHADTLHQARNSGAEQAEGEWLIFLDADDELDPGYIEAMAEVIGTLQGDHLVQPATFGWWTDGEDEAPNVIPRCDLKARNFMVIGTAVRREQFLRVGGFDDLPALEDWDLWLRCWLDGAEFAAAPRAIYRVWLHDGPGSQGSRNYDVKLGREAYAEIKRRYRRQRRRIVS